MEATMWLAEAAAMHPDGTVSMLRAGINRVMRKEKPVPFAGALVIRLEASLAESGPHSFEIRLMNDDGKDIAPRINGGMEVPTGGGSSHVVVNFHVTFPEFGRYEFSVNVDRVLYQSWKVDAVPVKEESE